MVQEMPDYNIKVRNALTGKQCAGALVGHVENGLLNYLLYVKTGIFDDDCNPLVILRSNGQTEFFYTHGIIWGMARKDKDEICFEVRPSSSIGFLSLCEKGKKK